MSESSSREKYDRQLRLWGERGQSALEHAHVCALGATVTICETLKNLVLPGIGSFTVVDHRKVSPADVGGNFFVSEEWVGQPLCRAVVEHLSELNETVSGAYIEEDPAVLVASGSDFLAPFDVVLVSQLPESVLLALDDMCQSRGIPLFYTRTLGLIGSLRCSLGNHWVLEAKPENDTEDLRIASPIPGVVDLAAAIDLDAMDDYAHAHVPWLLVLVKLLQAWKDAHQGRVPATRDEKDGFRAYVRDAARSPEEENFIEAAKNAFRAYAAVPIPSGIASIFAHPQCEALQSGTADVWVVARALREFVHAEGGGFLPVSGKLPDMSADTASFVSLQRVYHQKAEEDVNAVAARVGVLSSGIGQSPHAVPADLVRIMCKNAAYLSFTAYRSIRQELEDSSKVQEFSFFSSMPEQYAHIWYFVLRAVDRFYSERRVYPGAGDDRVGPDLQILRNYTNAVLGELGVAEMVSVTDEYLEEVCRYGGCELHTIASFMGGITAQEVIKSLTRQYTPMNNTFVYNGISSVSATFEA